MEVDFPLFAAMALLGVVVGLLAYMFVWLSIGDPKTGRQNYEEPGK
jgi:hypothetical protein